MAINMPSAVKSGRFLRAEILKPEELQEFMNFHGISKYELSDIFGVTIQGVNLWLKGKREFSIVNSRLVRLFAKYPHLIREF